MNEKNILIVGLKDKGKSTLANVLSGKENELKEDEFNEKIQTIEFEVGNEKYRVIDTVGINNEELKIRQILQMIGKEYKGFGNGLSQILFVINGTFSPEEVSLFNILREVLFDEKVINYISFVWNWFDDFEEESVCNEKTQSLLEKNDEEITEIINLCNKRIIYVDNPTINIEGKSKRVRDRIEFNKDSRQSSRAILLEHLKNWQEVYEPENFAKIDERIDKHVKKYLDARIKKLQKEIENKKKELAEKVKKMGKETEEQLKLIEEKIRKITKEKQEIMTFSERFRESIMQVSKCRIS